MKQIKKASLQINFDKNGGGLSGLISYTIEDSVNNDMKKSNRIPINNTQIQTYQNKSLTQIFANIKNLIKVKEGM